MNLDYQPLDDWERKAYHQAIEDRDGIAHLYGEVAAECSMLKAQVRMKDDEIIRLKAQLYDVLLGKNAKA